MAAAPEIDLAAFGLRRGDAVRFRRGERGRWHRGRLERMERDGSIGIRDDKGAARALRPHVVQIEHVTPHGAKTWEAVSERMGRGHQLELF